MGIRDWSNKHPKATASIGGGLIIVFVSVIAAEVLANRHGYPSGLPNAYYTINDGKTYFVANTSNFPPFEHGGQEAVRAYVFQCGSGKKFVGFLEKYSPQAKKELDAGAPLSPTIMRFGREVKRPGDSRWQSTANMAAETRIENITCPKGTGTLVNIEP